MTTRKPKGTKLKGEDLLPQQRVKMEDGDSGYSTVPLNDVDVGASSCGFDIPLNFSFTPFFDQHNYNDQLTFNNESPSLPSYDSYFADRDFPQMHHAPSYYKLPSTSLFQPQQSLMPSSSSGCSPIVIGEYLQSFEPEISVPVPEPNPDPVPEPEHEHEDRFPVGVRFQPTEEELISYYLMNKSSIFPLASVVHIVDFYKYEPWALHGMYPMVRVRERYFINREKKYEGGDRPNRMAGCGHWKYFQ